MKKWYERLPKHKMLMNPKSHRMIHPVYSLQEIEKVERTHYQPTEFKDKVALGAIKSIRWIFDKVTGYNPDKFRERDWLNRCIMLETVAGVPGMVAGTARHLRSLRLLQRDHGWIHHLLEEAENERMHLFFFLDLKQPGIMMRLAIVLAQGIFYNMFFISYLLAPRYCHRFVGYLEEEAVHTYTELLRKFDEGKLELWKDMKASKESCEYYDLKEGAPIREMLLSVRADEAVHREINHHFASIALDTNIDQEEVAIKTEQEKAEKVEESNKK